MRNKNATSGNGSGEIHNSDHVESSQPTPAIIISQASEESLNECYDPTCYNHLKDPLLQDSEDVQKLPTLFGTSKEKLNSNMTKPGSVTFSSGDLYRRDFLSSPTTSHVTLGFGSLDIIMENDKSHERECISPEK